MSIRASIIMLLCSTTFALAAEPIERTIIVSASPLQAWRSLCVDWQVKQWSGAVFAHFEIREGGEWRVSYENATVEQGVFELADPGNLLTYSLLHDEVSTSVQIGFRKIEAGTEIKISHSGFGAGRSGERRRADLTEYWEERLPLLSAYLDRIPGSYLARPERDGAYPAVLLLHDRFGLNRTTRDFADSLARAGYVALAVDMFKGDVTSDQNQAARFLELVNNEESIATTRDGFAFLREDDAVQRKRIAVWGMGYGGSMGLRVATQVPEIKLCVDWYGSELPPPDQTSRIAARIFGVFASATPSVPPFAAQEFNRRLVQAGIVAETVVVQGSDGFADPAYGMTFSPSTVTDAWRQTLLRLDRTLKL